MKNCLILNHFQSLSCNQTLKMHHYNFKDLNRIYWFCNQLINTIKAIYFEGFLQKFNFEMYFEAAAYLDFVILLYPTKDH